MWQLQLVQAKYALYHFWRKRRRQPAGRSSSFSWWRHQVGSHCQDRVILEITQHHIVHRIKSPLEMQWSNIPVKKERNSVSTITPTKEKYLIVVKILEYFVLSFFCSWVVVVLEGHCHIPVFHLHVYFALSVRSFMWHIVAVYKNNLTTRITKGNDIKA